MRYIIYGAGAIGGTIGGRLFQAGHEVILIARGDHLGALQEKGLRLRDPHGDVTLMMPAVAHPSAIDFRQSDVLLMCMKSQHSEAALTELKSCTEDIAIICAQNGVANERMAAKVFKRVYGMVVMLPATHLEAGVVLHHASKSGGILDAGIYPEGTDTFIEQVMSDLQGANFSAVAQSHIMRWKYAKLLNNLGNGLQAASEAGSQGKWVMRAMVQEALRCFEAAHIDCATRDEAVNRRGDLMGGGDISGAQRGGGSSWQSVSRGTGSIEVDYLNGEIVALGKQFNVPTPANELIRVLANKIATERKPPGSIAIEEIISALSLDH